MGLKSLLGVMLDPIFIILLLLLVGCVLMFYPAGIKWSKCCFLAATFLLLMFSLPIVPRTLLSHLETVDVATNRNTPPQWIVVLGGGANPRPSKASNVQLYSESLSRLIEGIVLAEKFPQAKLLVSGGSCGPSCNEALLMADTAQRLGIDPARIVLDKESQNTRQQAKRLQAMLGNQAFVLISSAYHLRRSLMWFHHYGMHPKVVASNYLSITKASQTSHRLMPRARNLLLSSVFLHEAFGMLEVQLVKRFSDL